VSETAVLTAAPALAVDGIEFAYDGTPVLFGTELAVAAGEVLALVGPNGAGKTTLLRVIAGLAAPGAGSVRLAGDDITSVATEARVLRGLAVVFGGRAVFGDLSVEANLQAGAEVVGRHLVAERIELTYSVFPRLGERRNALAAQLSGGEQQMLALGKALLLRPDVLCIDELSLGLAPALVDRLLDVIRAESQRGTAVILVEQSVRVALAVADRVAYFERGRVVVVERAEALAADPARLRSLFFQEAS
jgi:branched-chain amino acid transport system ATP-binding protein